MQVKVKIVTDKSNKIITLDLEEYLTGVVPGEVNYNWDEDVLKAQAIAARTYTVNKISKRASKEYHVTDSSAIDQAYRPAKIHARTTKAVYDTKGIVMTYDGKILDTAVYTDANGGRIRSCKEVWGSDRPYLVAKDDPYDKESGYKKHGHGVGMSQRGARVMASKGFDYKKILEFYYKGVQLVKLVEDKITETVKKPVFTGVIKYGDKSDKVKTLQKFLNKNGYSCGTADGIFGKKTQQALITWQYENGLEPDGIYGKKSNNIAQLF